jgi:transposase
MSAFEFAFLSSLPWGLLGRVPPTQMCDALNGNLPKLPAKLEVSVSHCLAHARRRFVEVVANFPEECRHVLETLGEVYQKC